MRVETTNTLLAMAMEYTNCQRKICQNSHKNKIKNTIECLMINNNNDINSRAVPVVLFHARVLITSSTLHHIEQTEAGL